MIDSRSVGDHRLWMAPPDCREAILRTVSCNPAIVDEECGIRVARMCGVKGTCRSIKSLFSERSIALASVGQLARQLDSTTRIIAC